jgi:DNA-binding MarR family transcriptional regulator/N-acetylglutamate synthase-like GNAT family acetyltransferase
LTQSSISSAGGHVGAASAVSAVSAVRAVRAFNRFYTRTIGVLGDHLLGSPYSLSEMRVLYELAHRAAPTATDLGRDLGMDAGYLSRVLRRFEARGLIARTAAKADARRSHLRLTARGRAAFAPLDRQAKAEVAALLGPLVPAARARVVDAMRAIERTLSPRPAATAPGADPYTLRPHTAGDMGWVVHRHGVLYWDEWRYNDEFEALVARICADFLDHLDPARERCWIAERDGVIIGCVFLVAQSKTVAKLRLLLVEPSARGLGLGRRLVDECIAFARNAGYRKLTLWTQSELTAARRIYKSAGFARVKQHKHDAFGRRGLIAETWDLDLSR